MTHYVCVHCVLCECHQALWPEDTSRICIPLAEECIPDYIINRFQSNEKARRISPPVCPSIHILLDLELNSKKIEGPREA